MGVKQQSSSSGVPTGGGQSGSGAAPAVPSSDLTPLSLAALLASEDLLFRDPFADLLPSSR